jgi:signal transduction histidine kinase
MRLADFIVENMEVILTEWDAFAGSLYPETAHMTPRALRDHAQQILEAIAADLRTSQTMREQAQKSMGHAPRVMNAAETAAQTHAVLRAQSGLDINQLAAEYRALRASVLRLWEGACHPGVEDLQDMIRFNEAIDQSLAESISFFSAQVNRSRNLLLGMLGHDMRNPLNAIVMVAKSLTMLNVGEVVSEAAECLIRSGASIQALLNDLVDFNRTTLGLGIAIAVGEADLGAIFADELQQLRAADPDLRLELQVHGDVRGRWDGPRLQQVLRNLVSNASDYGLPGEPVQVAVYGDEAGVRFDVTNRGPVVEQACLDRLFDPLARGAKESRESNKEGLGLGLYIVREITHAHGGEVAARSDAAGTVFSVRLPRICGNSEVAHTSEN